MVDKEWEKFQQKTWVPAFDYVLKEIDKLFIKEKKGIIDKKIKKNLILVRIYVPTKEFKALEKYRPFKKYHSLGGIPVIESKKDKILIDTEIVNPRKRKTRTRVYVTKPSFED